VVRSEGDIVPFLADINCFICLTEVRSGGVAFGAGNVPPDLLQSGAAFAIDGFLDTSYAVLPGLGFFNVACASPDAGQAPGSCSIDINYSPLTRANSVPEPGTLSLLIAGLGCLLARMTRRAAVRQGMKST
jgi:hypothetical protein